MNRSNTSFAEVREHAVRLVQEHRGESPSCWAAIELISLKIGSAQISPQNDEEHENGRHYSPLGLAVGSEHRTVGQQPVYHSPLTWYHRCTVAAAG
jgi:hypothetical protein